MSGKVEAQVSAENADAKLIDQRDDNPIKNLSSQELTKYVNELYTEMFEKGSKEEGGKKKRVEKRKKSHIGAVTRQELLRGAAHAKYYLHHKEGSEDHIEVLTKDGKEINRPRKTGEIIGQREWQAYKVQEDPKFWHEPKDLVVTLVACCLASFTQGWDQMANGNLGWPGAFRLDINNDGSGGRNGGTGDFWIVGGVNSITWFAAAILGPFFVDPLAQWTDKLGRRGAVLIAALFSLASMIGGSRATSWQGYFVARLFLGIGIGAKASLVPIWESEILPPAKRGRLLVSWQFFTATGIFAGSIATYIFRTNWRNQVLSGALPALVLLIVTYFGTESPRYLILHGKFHEAFEALLRLRGERILAAEELCYIHFLIQAERATIYAEIRSNDLGLDHKPLSYWYRLKCIPQIPRNLYAALATMVVMISQQLSGINILGFVSSIFFFTAGLRSQPASTDEASIQKNAYDSLRFSIGFGLANAIFSAIAYFLIEPLPLETRLESGDFAIQNRRAPRTESSKGGWRRTPNMRSALKLIRGRRALLMTSLGGGALMLFVLTFLLRLDASNDAKMPLVMIFIILWTFFYSPGAGCVPFVYSAEVWPNEGREVGMSWAVCCNFIGAGFLALFVPRGLRWGPSKLFGLFTGLSLFGMILVYLLVPATDRAKSLDDMSKRFDEKDYIDFNKEKMKTLINPTRIGKKSRSQSSDPPVRSDPALPSGPPVTSGAPMTPEVPVVRNDQIASDNLAHSAGPRIVQLEPPSDDEDDGAPPSPNTQGHVQASGGTSDPTGMSHDTGGNQGHASEVHSTEPLAPQPRT